MRSRRRSISAGAGPQQLHVGTGGIRADGCLGAVQEFIEAGGLRRVGAQHRQMGEGRPAAAAAKLQGGGGKAGIALFEQLAQQRMLGKPRLQHQKARLFAPAGPAGHLDQRLRQPFRAPEFLRKQALVRVDHRHQAEAGEIVAFGEHLGAEQDAVAALADAAQDMLQPAPAAHIIAVHARHRVIGEARLKLFLQALGSAPYRLQRRAAFPAHGRRTAPGAAMMAEKQTTPTVEHHARVAMAAFLRLPAVRAHQHRREAAAVQVQQHLRA